MQTSEVSKMATQMGRFLTIALILWIYSVGAQYDSVEQCDRIIWDNRSDSPGIKNVLAHCAEGSVEWNSPNGALRVTLQFQNPTRPFQGCFKASTQFTVAKISREKDGELETIVKLDGANPSIGKEICFDSHDGEKIVLFIEASKASSTTSRILLAYDLERLSNTVAKDDMEDCRPCTDEEILDSFCSSDFVVVGTLAQVQHNNAQEETEVQLLVHKLHHQKTKQFKRVTGTRGKLRGTVIAPLKCGVRHGNGEFLVTGRIRLGRAYLQCAPRLDDWERIKNVAIRTGNTVCSADED